MSCPQPYCNPCEKTLCTGERAECVYYHLSNDAVNKLSCLGLPNNVSVEEILETINARVCQILGRQRHLVVTDTDSVDLEVSGIADHTLTGEIKISSDEGNILEVHEDGLYISETGKLSSSEDDEADYLEDQLVGDSDGVVNISAVVHNGKIKLQPSLDISALINQIKETIDCSELSCD